MERKRKDIHLMPDATLSDDPEEVQFLLNNFQGIPFPGPPFDLDILEQAVKFKPDPTDIFVVTYPKCGTTWMQYIVWEIINKGLPPPSPNEMMYHSHTFTYIEFNGVDKLQELEPPRLIKSHLPFHLVPYHPLAKYIYVVRNPWDCCVSYYHYKRKFPKETDLSFQKFVDYFIQGKLPYGEFFDHVFSWYEHKNDFNVLFLTYEDMSVDPKGTMLKTAKFLGDDHYNVLNDETILNNCLKYSNFKYVKDLGAVLPKSINIPDKCKSTFKDTIKEIRETLGSMSKANCDAENYKELDFFRRGVVGDWKNCFTQNEMRRFNDYIMAKVSGTELEYTWTLRSGELNAK